jgi:hypothetical protein
LGIGDTIESHIVGDLTLDSWQQWLTFAHAARISDAEAARLIEEKTNTLVDCLAYGPEARDPVRALVGELARLGDGLIWTIGHSWRCRDLLARPTDLDLAL